MFAKLASLFMRRPSPSAAETVARLMGPCQLCGKTPTDHPQWIVGSAISSKTPNRVAELDGLISAGQWVGAAQIQEWEGSEDEVQYVALRCPVASKITVKKIQSVVELWSDDRCLADVVVDESGQQQIDALADGRWSLPRVRVG